MAASSRSPSKKLTVHPVNGELGRYYVESETTDGKSYFVDIEEYSGLGKCDCPRFRCDIEPFLKNGVRKRCKHIDAAREYLGKDLVFMWLQTRRLKR